MSSAATTARRSSAPLRRTTCRCRPREDRLNDVLNARRARAAAAWELSREIVLVGAGEPLSIPGGADATYPFLAHTEYVWLADRNVPGAVVAFDPQSGWVDFVPDVTELERVWEGREQEPGESLKQFPAWLAARRARPIVMLGSPLPGFFGGDLLRTHELRELLLHARRPKDAVEIERLRAAAAATAAGFAKLAAIIRPGITERALQIELEAEFFRHGGTRTAYESIVASGPRSAVLHSPASDRVLKDGELLLVDAGAEVNRYACDVTRTYAANDKLAGLQRELYDIVLAANRKACAACTPGREWRDVHQQSALDMIGGMVELGLLRGTASGLVESEAHTLFYPHGLGHLVGLGVRDASGRLPGDTRATPPALRTLRTDLPLQAGYVITVEPGLYFVAPLLRDAERRKRYRDAVNWERVDQLIEFGGVRIEDNVLVTERGPDILTAAIPK